MDHYRGINPDERYKNDVLNELRLIRELLVRNAQMVEQPKPTVHRGPRGAKKT